LATANYDSPAQTIEAPLPIEKYLDNTNIEGKGKGARGAWSET